MTINDAADWSARHPAVHREYLLDENGRRELALLHHPGYPFIRQVDHSAKPSVLFDALRGVADEYLEHLAEFGPVRQTVPDTLLTQHFGWLPLTWYEPSHLLDPRGSFAVQRRSASGDELDCTVVLLAAQRALADDGQTIVSVSGLQVGLRVVMHLGAPPRKGRGRREVRITGLSQHGLARARTSQRILLGELSGYSARAVASFGFATEPMPTLTGFEFKPDGTLRVAGGGVRDGFGYRRSYEWLLEIKPGDRGVVPPVLPFAAPPRLVQQVSDHAATPARSKHALLFDRDPASMGDAEPIDERKPTRDDDVLNYFRKRIALPNFPTSNGQWQLVDPGPAPRFKVLRSVVVDQELHQMGQVQQIDPDPDRLKSPRNDHLSALQAALRAAEFFAVMKGFGLDEQAYFKFARLPLLLQPRASFDARPDGKTVNGQVRLEGPPMPLLLTSSAKASRPQLEVRFGAAELHHRRAALDDRAVDPRVSAQPIGIAADSRIAWHEFGHVLSYAATSALEFHFAHSAGDALAAVLSDPASGLAASDDETLSPLRGHTFPWLSMRRRHDRQAAAGWCWCGRRNGMRLAATAYPPLLYKGYTEEQMLSSSLFRFYTAIGGAAANPGTTRTTASLRCAYLVLRGIALLGPAWLVPVRSAEAFAAALIDADIGTGPAGPQQFPGGRLHKVVRWAFERQGLYATRNPRQQVEGAGVSARVDLWIRDLRNDSGDQGGYAACALHWGTSTDLSLPWHAHPIDGFSVKPGKVRVKLRNRGSKAADAVDVRVWAAADSTSPISKLVWKLVGQHSLRRVPACSAVSLEIAAMLPSRRPYLVIVEASCAADRSNLDPRSALPCANGTPPERAKQVIDLVAHDNNIALRRIVR